MKKSLNKLKTFFLLSFFMHINGLWAGLNSTGNNPNSFVETLTLYEKYRVLNPCEKKMLRNNAYAMIQNKDTSISEKYHAKFILAHLRTINYYIEDDISDNACWAFFSEMISAFFLTPNEKKNLGFDNTSALSPVYDPLFLKKCVLYQGILHLEKRSPEFGAFELLPLCVLEFLQTGEIKCFHDSPTQDFNVFYFHFLQLQLKDNAFTKSEKALATLLCAYLLEDLSLQRREKKILCQNHADYLMYYVQFGIPESPFQKMCIGLLTHYRMNDYLNDLYVNRNEAKFFWETHWDYPYHQHFKNSLFLRRLWEKIVINKPIRRLTE